MEGRGIIHTAAADQEEDRFSDLPDEVIHEILCRLGLSKQPAQLAILLKRWNHLWRSYPVFDFDDFDWPIERRWNLETFLTAAAQKFSDLGHMAAVRMKQYESCRDSDLLDKLLGFVSTVTQEVQLNCSSPFEDVFLPQGLLNDNSFRSLKVVKLQYCRFPSGCSVRFGASLQVLSLKDVGFPYINREGDRILNSMIESAPCLETLKLGYINGIKRIRIRDCLNLISLRASKFAGYFEISGKSCI